MAAMERNAFLKSGLVTLLAGLSVTAVFAAMGFIAAFGREQFLGINLSDWSLQTLTILAGRCAADSFFMVLNLAASHWVVLTVGVVVAGAGAVLFRHGKLPRWAGPAMEGLAGALLLVWVLTSIVNFEGPTIPLRGWVVAPDFESPLDKAICELSSPSDACNKRISKAGSAGVTRIKNYYYARHSDNPGVLLLEATSLEAGRMLSAKGFKDRFHSPENAQKLLYSRYATVIVVCGLALLYVAITSRLPESRIGSDYLSVLRTAIIIASGVSTVMLPYVYGKLIDPALFPNAFITYTEPNQDTVDANGNKSKGGDPILRGGGFPVISQTDRSLFLLWVQFGGGHTKIIEVPRDRIVAINFVASVDALAKISECQAGNQGADCE